MTALPAESRPVGPWDPDSAEDVCAGCGVVFVWRDGWDGECLECAVLRQEHLSEHLDGRHSRAVIACRHCE